MSWNISFAASTPDDETASAATEDELFCDYLEARLQQAIEALNAAREQLNANPEFNRAATVMRHVQELRELKTQLEQARVRVNAEREAAGKPPMERTAGQTTAPPEFRAAQAEQATRIMAALAAKPRTCPSCQAPILDNSATDCACRDPSNDFSTPVRGVDRESPSPS